MQRLVILLLATIVSCSQAKLYPNTSTTHHKCSAQKPVTSCSKATMNLADVDTCCQETYGGIILSTQFWDTYTGKEHQGQLLPKDHWTLHGLWPDLCNGSFTQYCDFDRQYDPNPSPPEVNGKTVPKYHGPSIDTFVKHLGKSKLLNWMNTFWVSQGQSNSDFWAHEFSKHATCYSTFDTPCYERHHKKHQDVVDFFETAAMYYSRLPTFDWLKDAGIVPCNKTSYSLNDITKALETKYGAKPYVGCRGPRYNETSGHKNDTGFTVLSEIWYFSHVKGRPQEGNSVHINSTTNSTCSEAHGAIRYLERTPDSERSVHHMPLKII